MPRPPLTHKAEGLELDFDKAPGLLSDSIPELSIGFFTLDLNARIIAWNPGAERITGYARSQVCGKHCEMFEGPHAGGFDELARLVTSASAEAAGLENHRTRIISSRSSELHLLLNARLLRDPSGMVYGALASFCDLTSVLGHAPTISSAPSAAGLAGLVGQSAPMQEVFRRLQLASDSDVTTLITGESGTGKELAARAIHSLSDRSEQPFVAINCSAIPEGLLESELFGHVKGAFTGAIRDRKGVFESAQGGTLLLDEIGDVSPLIQLKLLRVLQEREIQRVGDDKCIPIDVRLLAATNRDLLQRVSEGQLREDFYYRIRVFEIRMPALRERPEDLPVLARHLLQQASKANGKSMPSIAHDAMQALTRYPWPGNVRELQNTIEHALVIQQGEMIGLLDLPEELRDSGSTGRRARLDRPLTPEQAAERLRILQALDENNWNRTKTSQSLGVSRVTLWKKIRRYQIDEGIFKRGTRERFG